MKVGRCDLLLIDSNIEGNRPEDRELTSRLYGGDSRVRIRQELLLGIGGVPALTAVGVSPRVVQLHESHSPIVPPPLLRPRIETERIQAAEAHRRVAPPAG